MSKRARHGKAKKSKGATLDATPAPASSDGAKASAEADEGPVTAPAERITAVEGLGAAKASEPPPAVDEVPPSRARAETPVAYATPVQPESAAVAASAPSEAIPRDEGSLAPVDLDSDFFDAAPVHEAEPPHEALEGDRRPHPKLTRAAAERRAHLTRYVRFAVGAASALCLAALVKVAVARGDSPQGAHAASARPTEVLAAVTPPVVQAAVPETVAAAVAAPDPVAVAEPAAEPQAVAVAAPEPAAVTEPAADPKAAPAAVTEATSANPAPASEPDPKAAASAKRASQQALERGKLVDAIEAGEKSVSLDPTDAEAWLILGAAYQEKGDLASARRSFKSCLEQGKRGPRGECAQMPH